MKEEACCEFAWNRDRNKFRSKQPSTSADTDLEHHHGQKHLLQRAPRGRSLTQRGALCTIMLIRTEHQRRKAKTYKSP